MICAGRSPRLFAGVLMALATATASAAMQVETVMPPLPVDAANTSVFATPLAVRDGAVYTVNVEDGPAGDDRDVLGLQTVIRRGERGDDGHWQWRSHVLDAHTARDPYHTQASVALDTDGYVHVAYNMHYMPWRYSISTRPDSIDAFKFRGQRTSLASRRAAQNDDIEFPGPGHAAISGNQVTYPAFFTDRRGTLYLTYRYALKPMRSWHKRIFAGGITRYDVETRQWHQIGGTMQQNRGDAALAPGVNSATTRPFAMEPGWWVYQIRLAFDRDNGMHASWLWRHHNSGPESIKPSYAYSPAGSDRFFRSDGSAYTLPITFDAAERAVPAALAPRGFYNPARMMVTAAGDPVVSIQPIGDGRYGIRRGPDGRWRAPQSLPYEAWQVRFDDRGHEWAFARGLTVLRRAVDPHGRPQSAWRVVFKGDRDNGGRLCNPRVVKGQQPGEFFVHANVLADQRCRAGPYRNRASDRC